MICPQIKTAARSYWSAKQVFLRVVKLGVKLHIGMPEEHL
jgi:hypothetical protein